ncbi:MAG: 30S ribosomal protein S7 [Elusimicrobia bacterium]|jgi:small subunit ribosomal protein S7|nr:30S ribosomal protein S7 [Elusimicrobiota bacterium]
MPRKALKPREKRGIPDPDFKFSSVLAARFIGRVNFMGKKVTAEKIFYGAMDQVKEKTGEDAMTVFNRAIENARPLLEVRPRRVGGATYQVPNEVRPERGQTIAFKWILQVARGKSGKPMANRLAEEILLCAKKEGPVMKKREDSHKMAEANQAFAHYRW